MLDEKTKPERHFGHREVDFSRFPSVIWQLVRMKMDQSVRDLSTMMHHSGTMQSGEEWVIEMVGQCGYRGRLILQLDEAGNCGDSNPVVNEEVMDAVKKNEGLMKSIIEAAPTEQQAVEALFALLESMAEDIAKKKKSKD